MYRHIKQDASVQNVSPRMEGNNRQFIPSQSRPQNNNGYNSPVNTGSWQPMPWQQQQDSFQMGWGNQFEN